MPVPSRPARARPCKPAARCRTAAARSGAMSMSAGSSDVDRAVAEEHAGHEPRIDAVVAAPRLHVVLEDRAGDDAGRAVPRRAVAGVVADEQVRRVLEIGPGIERRRYRTPRGCRRLRRSASRSPFSLPMISRLQRVRLGAGRRRCPAARGPSGSGTCRSGPRQYARVRDQSTSRSHSARPSAPGFSTR